MGHDRKFVKIDTRSTDYHDYIFKDGKLVGKFDDMYNYSREIPWHQDETSYSIFSNIDIVILQQYQYQSICEIGCGLGYVSNRLNKELTSKDGGRPTVTEIDVSQTAINKAKSLFPEVRFICSDLLKERPLLGEYFDLVMIKEVFWYVCNNLKQFLQNVVALIKDDGFLYISQSFPEEKKWVGQEIIDSPDRLKSILLQYVKPVYYCVEWDWNYNGRPLVHFLGKINETENKLGNKIKINHY